MEREAFLAELGKPDEGSLYRRLYLYCPEAFEKPVRSWEEFCGRFAGNGVCRNLLTETAPTPISSFFSEDEFFLSKMPGEVSIVVNARYCPAFLHRLEFVKVIYVFRGNCSFFAAENRYEMPEGSVCIVAPGVEQAVFSCGDEDIVLNLLIRRSTFSKAFPELLEISDGGVIADFFWRMLYQKPGGEFVIFSGCRTPLLEESVMELYEEATHKSVKSGLIMKSMMLSVFAYILRWEEKMDPDKRRAESLIRRGRPEGKKKEGYFPLPGYLQYMRRNVASVDLSRMAGEFAVSEGYLSRYLRKETGYTFSQILREMKLEKAKELLVSTECSVQRICDLIGYTDQSIFFRNFKESFGMSPMRYRKKSRSFGFRNTELTY
ncbi:MAG: AraC family transcriptional regulator [Eubacteriales bacterium]|nr:AraC family transcriptional regulator [Eubacteriales bacterium]